MEQIFFVARDRDGKLYLYDRKPSRNVDGYWDGVEYLEIRHNQFQGLSWEDEPLEVRLEIVER